MKIRQVVIVLTVSLLGIVSCSRSLVADLFVQVGDGTPQVFFAGATATIPVFAYNTDPGSPINLDGYDLAFEIGGDGVGIPGTPDFFTSFQADFIGSAFGQNVNSYIDALPFLPNSYDLVVGNSGTSFLVPGIASPAKLFELQFAISALTTPGLYNLSFVPNATSNGADLNAISGIGTAGVILGIGTGSQLNQFQVAIPEPGAFGLVAFGWSVVSNRRSRRRARVHHGRC